MSLNPEIVAVLSGESDGCIITGDCLEIMADMPDGCVDAVVTDWPYSSGTRREGQKGVRKSMNRTLDDALWFEMDSMTTHGWAWMARSVAWESVRLMHVGDHALFFIDWRMYPIAYAAIENGGLRLANLLVWDKEMFGMGACFRNQHELIIHATRGVGHEPMRRDIPNVIRCAAVRNGEHPTEKPLLLMETILEPVIAQDGIVLDPFCGSGTTCVAAKKLGRRWIGIEIDPGYAEKARRRVASTPKPLFVEEPPKPADSPLFGDGDG